MSETTTELTAEALADELAARAIPLPVLLDAGKLLLARAIDDDPEALQSVLGWAQGAGIPIPRLPGLPSLPRPRMPAVFGRRSKEEGEGVAGA